MIAPFGHFSSNCSRCPVRAGCRTCSRRRCILVKIVKRPTRFPRSALVFRPCQSQNHRTNSVHIIWSISFEMAAVASGMESLQAEQKKNPFSWPFACILVVGWERQKHILNFYLMTCFPVSKVP